MKHAHDELMRLRILLIRKAADNLEHALNQVHCDDTRGAVRRCSVAAKAAAMVGNEALYSWRGIVRDRAKGNR